VTPESDYTSNGDDCASEGKGACKERWRWNSQAHWHAIRDQSHGARSDQY